MPPRGKLLSFVLIIIFFGLILFVNTPTKADTGATPKYFTGFYDGDMSIFYFIENFDMGNINNGNNYTTNINPNMTNSQGYLFTASSIEIRAYDLLNGSGTNIIANNLSAQSNVTSAMKVAQEFMVDHPCTIQQLTVYMNYSVRGSFNSPTIFKFSVTEDDLTSVLAEYEYTFYSDQSGSSWFYLWLNPNVIQPNTTYFVLFEYLAGASAIGIGGGNEGPGLPGTSWPFVNKSNPWVAQNHNSSAYNAGLTLKYNGSAWVSIENDTTRDMLCYFTYDIIVDPDTLGLQLLINDESCAWTKQLPEWGSGYEVYCLKSLSTIYNQPINVTVALNQTIPSMMIEEHMLYVYFTPAYGTYNASNSGIEWTVTYPSKNVRDIMWPTGQMFAFESDWDYIEFLDPSNVTISNVFFGPITVYNQSYYAALLEFPFGSIDPGDYTGIFRSPNYCSAIQAKQKEDLTLKVVSSFELGQTVQLDALIRDSMGNPISGGNATINFTSPTGQVMTFTNLSAEAGVVSSGEFELMDDLETGVYTASIFWTNGQEIGCYSFEIEVATPSSMLIWYILIGTAVALAAAAYPIISYSRRKLQTRNWEKHLRNLFVLSKDGRSIYGYSFGIEIQDPALVSAALMAISSFVSDAVKSKKGLRVIDLEDKKVILGHGDNVTTALIAEKDFPIIRNRTEQFTQAFEERYGGKVASWTGDSSVFKGTDKLIQEYFPVSMEERITRGVKLKLIETHERLESAVEPEVLIGIMREITQLLQRYREIIEEHYMDEYTKLMQMFDEKIANTT